ncbi:Centrosomal protein of 76 kDa [Entophlyctis luteolus]|nr:Centrosomal protein of 76 kDa [Entophlyctis luteolus]
MAPVPPKVDMDADARLDAAKTHLLESGVVDAFADKIAACLSALPAAGSVVQPDNATGLSSAVPYPIASDKRYLLLTIQKGIAFLAPQDVSEDASTSLELHIQYRDKRISSKPVLSAVEPNFSFQRLIELHVGSPLLSLLTPIQTTDVQSLLQCTDKLHLIAIRMHHPSGSVHFVGTAVVDIRESLCGGQIKKLVELKEIGEDVTVGVLEMSMECVPRSGVVLEHKFVSIEEVKFQTNQEQQKFDEMNRLFFMYAKQWWNDFLQIRSCHADRQVKLFAFNEHSQKMPVTNFVHPLRSRLLENSQQAVRFVSLLNSFAAEVWTGVHTTVTLSSCNAASRANLLTSLLRGFSLPAYTVLGHARGSGDPGAWVVLFRGSGTTPEIIDPSTGRRFRHDDPAVPVLRVGCAFCEDGFWANVGACDLPSGMCSDLADARYWKSFGRDAISAVKLPEFSNFPLAACTLLTLPSVDTEIDLEATIRNQVAVFRDSNDLRTAWDDDLSHLLSQCLRECEANKLLVAAGKVTGSSISDSGVSGIDFQLSIRRFIPEGHTFKGFPIHFNTTNSQKIFAALAQVKACRSLMLTRGDHVRFAVRVKIVGYAERCVACWVMLSTELEY